MISWDVAPRQYHQPVKSETCYFPGAKEEHYISPGAQEEHYISLFQCAHAKKIMKTGK